MLRRDQSGCALVCVGARLEELFRKDTQPCQYEASVEGENRTRTVSGKEFDCDKHGDDVDERWSGRKGDMDERKRAEEKEKALMQKKQSVSSRYTFRPRKGPTVILTLQRGQPTAAWLIL